MQLYGYGSEWEQPSNENLHNPGLVKGHLWDLAGDLADVSGETSNRATVRTRLGRMGTLYALDRWPAMPPNTVRGKPTNRNRANKSTMVPNGRAAVEAWAMAVVFRKANEASNGTAMHTKHNSKH